MYNAIQSETFVGENLANFVVLSHGIAVFCESFSRKFMRSRAEPTFLISNPRKFSLRNAIIIFLPIRESLSPAKVSVSTVCDFFYILSSFLVGAAVKALCVAYVPAAVTS